MSDVVVSVTESTTAVTVTEQDVAVAVTETSVDVSSSTAGIQGATGATGAGYSGVTSTSTITIGSGLKTFTLVSANQGAFLTGMRIRAIHSDTPTYYLEGTANYVGAGTLIITVDKFNGSGSHNLWAFAVAGEVGQTGATGPQGTAGVSGVISVTSPITNSGSASSAIVGIDQTLLSLTRSQISDFTSGTVAVSGTASYATTSGTGVYATTSGTAVNISGSITKSQVSDFSSGTVAVSGTASYATTSGTAVSISGSITKSQVSDFTSGTVTSISGTVTQSQVTSLVTDLAGKASTSAPTITGITTIQATPGIGTDTPLTVLGGTGQSVPLQSWKTVSLVQLSTVDQNGYGNFARLTAGQGTDLAYSAALSVNTTGTAVKGLVIRGAASQSANLQEWQTSAGTVVTKVNSAGVINAVQLQTTNGYFTANEASSGGFVFLSRMTAQAASPGANNARIYFRDGTNSGTLKLVVRAGASGAETTILDNIPQT